MAAQARAVTVIRMGYCLDDYSVAVVGAIRPLTAIHHEPGAMFTFFGLFADPVSGLSERISAVWPGVDVVRIEQPICTIGARFGPDLYVPELEDIPGPVVGTVEQLSAEYSSARFLLLRTECFGGICGNWGQIIQDGKTILEACGGGALSRLIKHFGVDLGPREFFDPLRRDYFWKLR